MGFLQAGQGGKDCKILKGFASLRSLITYLKQSYTYEVKVRNVGKNVMVVFVVSFTRSIASNEVFLLFTKSGGGGGRPG